MADAQVAVKVRRHRVRVSLDAPVYQLDALLKRPHGVFSLLSGRRPACLLHMLVPLSHPQPEHQQRVSHLVMRPEVIFNHHPLPAPLQVPVVAPFSQRPTREREVGQREFNALVETAGLELGAGLHDPVHDAVGLRLVGALVAQVLVVPTPGEEDGSFGVVRELRVQKAPHGESCGFVGVVVGAGPREGGEVGALDRDEPLVRQHRHVNHLHVPPHVLAALHEAGAVGDQVPLHDQLGVGRQGAQHLASEVLEHVVVPLVHSAEVGAHAGGQEG
mmetsp:Transcript_40032/g.99061  ORF Transcript_40032/g.99061 Transcript_40032/m.99061 type:complete len:274 (-) Transcript_40032:74-895(-)